MFVASLATRARTPSACATPDDPGITSTTLAGCLMAGPNRDFSDFTLTAHDKQAINNRYF
jgi:hypothetical protein